ncbi:ABC transporter permease subunit [Lichenicoccus roseus]|uniref:Ribose ABC transporter permease n=1 Tax=Lichenicoccus roseus TaxID=2683649 RepID=A0A5R9JG12_9PROT|nr:ribose ABC transporter permease [Lichenicoccus roseus]TLU73218.1 ribose ABC transporter permease [Lichenicoccus roseus]
MQPIDSDVPTKAVPTAASGVSTSSAATAEAPFGGAGLSARQVRLRSTLQAAGMLPVLILLAIGFHLFGGHRFLTGQNLSIVAQQASINCVLAAGMTFVILTGGIDLSVGSILAASAMGALIASLWSIGGGFAVPVCLLIGLVIGGLNGGLIAYGKLPPFIVTLGSLTAVRGLARLMGADNTIFNPNLSYAWIGNDGLTIFPGVAIPWLAIIAVAVILVSWYVLKRTVLGVRIYAVGGNPAAARLSGINVPLILMFVYSLSGLLAGLGGVMSSARLYAANGLQLGQSYELDAIAAVILGGTSFVGGIGSIWGTLIGALIIAVLSNGLILLGVSDIWQFIVKGLVIIGAVALDRFRQQGGART